MDLPSGGLGKVRESGRVAQLTDGNGWRSRETPMNAWDGPQTPEEEILCAIIKDILQAEYVGRNESFFSLTGDSVSALRLVVRARQAGLDITIRDVFEAKTVRALALRATGPRRQHEPSRSPSAAAGGCPFVCQHGVDPARWPSQVRLNSA